MGGIFVSYRRELTIGWVGRLCDDLRDAFGKKTTIFQDIDSIPYGQDWFRAVDEAIATSDVVLVVIGPKWLSCTDDDGNRRLDNPEDPVHYEIAQAFSRNKSILPLVVGGAGFPKARDLP